MATKRNVIRVPATTDFACNDVRRWYLDIYGLEGAQFNKVHLFIAKKENTELFEDMGQVLEAAVSKVDGNPNMECIDVLASSNKEFQLSPIAYAFACMCKDKDETMFSRGWEIEESSSSLTADHLHTSIVAALKGKKVKASRPPARKQAKQQKVASSKTGSLMDVDKVSSASSQQGSSSKLKIVDPETLETEAKKGQEKDTGGMNKYLNYFPFQYREFDISVKNCWLAPDHYNARILDKKHAEGVLFGFSRSTTKPAACAYLMPVRNAKAKQGTPMTLEEIDENKLQDYQYWILDGQHSIYAAKVLLFNEQKNKEIFDRLINVYAFRKARIVVNPPPLIATAISVIANDEAKALYVKQPYSQILRHLRSQWIFSERPSRPATGVVEGHASRAGWDGFFRLAKMSAGASLISKQAHMVTYSDHVYNCWIKIIESLEKENKKPPTTVFRYLCGLEESEVILIQEEIQEGKILLSRTAKDGDVFDMYDRVKQLKQDRLIQDALIEGFNALNESSSCQSWEEIVSTYNINEIIYKKILSLCEDWLESSLKRGIKKKEFPEEAVKYMQWVVQLQKIKDETEDVPWSIYVVSLQIEESHYLKRHFTNRVPLGLCVLDLTKRCGQDNFQWSSAEIFSKALDGMLDVAGGSTDPGFVLLAFVDFSQLTNLQCAFKSMGDNLSYQCCGALHHFPSAPCKGAIQFLTVVAFLGQHHVFEDLRRRSEDNPIPIDCSLLSIPEDGISNSQYLEAKKQALVKHYIRTYCYEDRKLVDLFGDGSLAAQEGLRQKKEVISLVMSVEEQAVLSTKLLDFAKSHASIAEWAGLQIQQSMPGSNADGTIGAGSTRQTEAEEEAEKELTMEDYLEMENHSQTRMDIEQSSATVETIDSATSKVSKMDNNSLSSSKVVQFEGEEIRVIAPTMQPASIQNENSPPNPLPIIASSSSKNAEKSILTIILDLNGLLLKRSPQPSVHHKSVQLSSNRYIILRPGCIEFLKTILQRFNVAIWSTATRTNVLQILRALDKLAGDRLSFFTAWSQEGCYIAQSQKLFKPDNPNVEAMFKPLVKIAMGFECDPQRTVLIDDSPYKGCVSPANNCIFPSQFDSEKIVDNVLLGELLPYLLQLDEGKDVRDLIASSRYGQPPLANGSEYKEIIKYWKHKNDVWSAKAFLTRRISLRKDDKGEAILEDKRDESRDNNIQSKTRRAEIQEILKKEGTPIEMMKTAQLSSLARRLGCSTKGPLKATTARAYINKVKAEYNLLNLDGQRS